MDYGQPKIHKLPIHVSIFFTNGDQMRGEFYGRQGQRLSDVLNDHRMFIPFEDIAGEYRMVNKTNIRDVQSENREE